MNKNWITLIGKQTMMTTARINHIIHIVIKTSEDVRLETVVHPDSDEN